MAMVQPRGSALVVHRREDYGRTGRALVGFGLVIAVLALPLGLLGIEALLLSLIAPAVFILVGGIFHLTDTTALVFPESQSVEIEGELFPVKDIAAIVAFSRVVEVRTKSGPMKSRRFGLGLFQSDQDVDAAGVLRELGRDAEALLRQRGPKDAYRSAQRRIGRMDEQLRRVLRPIVESSLVLGDHGDQIAVWRGAEALAKALDVPLVDVCGGRATLRVPAELDLPVVDRLACGLMTAPPVGPAPRGFRIAAKKSRLRVAWERPVRPLYEQLAFIFGLTLLAVLLGALLGLGMASAWGLLVGLLGLFSLRVARTLGPHRLTLGQERLSVERGVWFRQMQSITLEALEELRVNHELAPSLDLVSDSLVISLPMAACEAEWLRAKLERRLARRADAAREG